MRQKNNNVVILTHSTCTHAMHLFNQDLYIAEHNFGKNSVIFSKIGNVSGQLGIFSANWEKIWYRKPDPVLYREKALY